MLFRPSRLELNRLQQIESEFYKHASVNETARTLDVDLDVVDLIFHYWILKRKVSERTGFVLLGLDKIKAIFVTIVEPRPSAATAQNVRNGAFESATATGHGTHEIVCATAARPGTSAEFVLHGQPAREAVSLLLSTQGADVSQAGGCHVLQQLVHRDADTGRAECHPAGQPRAQHLRHHLFVVQVGSAELHARGV